MPEMASIKPSFTWPCKNLQQSDGRVEEKSAPGSVVSGRVNQMTLKFIFVAYMFGARH